jgi:GNAT superfamily N-acetyltransferase
MSKRAGDDLPGIGITQVITPGDAGSALRAAMTRCWIEVTNAGGAAGFPFPPVDAGAVRPAVDSLASGLDRHRSRILIADLRGELAGWVVLNSDPGPLTGHWGTVHHLQTHPAFRSRGVGSALLRQLRKVARDEMGLEQLHLAARGGMGLEDFYARLGWREIGRWPRKLRLSADDSRDEVLMILDPL